MSQLQFFLLLWILVGIVLFFWLKRSRSYSIGLPLAYFMGMFLIHFPGASIYLIPSYRNYNPESIKTGFALATYGMLMFFVGVFVMTKLDIARTARVRRREQAQVVAPSYISKLGWNCLLVGLLISLVVLPRLGSVATLVSLVSGVAGLTVVGICLGIWGALLQTDKKKLRLWVLATLMLPLVTLASSAFVSYGTNLLIVVMGFLLLRTRTGPMRLLGLLVAFYLGLSFFVTYMRDRTDIRTAIWYENAEYNERFGLIADLFTSFEFFDSENPRHLLTIDERLNQNWLVGASISYLGNGRDFANGETLWFSVIGLIPRVLWPDKPSVGGGGDIVTSYTGIQFAQGTSVGAGQVLEFYVNFGRAGVTIGFLLLGLLIKFFDSQAARALASNNFRQFIVWVLAGLGFLQAGGNLVEVTTSVVAGIASGLAISVLVRQRAPLQRSAVEFAET